MNLLIVSPEFPPDTGVGTLRISSLSKYLKSKGYNITIITREKKNEKNYSLADKYIEIKEKTNSGGLVGSYRLYKNNKVIYENTAESLIKENSYRLVLITGGPFYTMGICEIANKYNIPCIIDFRDPWSFDIRGIKDFFSVKRNAYRLYYRFYEKKTIMQATMVVTVTEAWSDKLRTMYPKESKKIKTIYNGYDDDRLEGIEIPSEQHQSDDMLKLAVFGKVFYYSEYYSKQFLKGYRLFLQRTKSSILQVGEREKNADSLLVKNNISLTVLKSTGFVDYEMGFKMLYAANAFIIIDSRKGALGTKIYDYIFIGKTVIYIGPRNSALANLVLNIGGYVCNNYKEVYCALKDIYSNSKQLKENYDKTAFARSIQNRKYEIVIRDVIDSY